MKTIKIPTWYYQQFDADYNLDIPAKGFGGWKKTDLPIEPEKTALVIMHAWDCGNRNEYPGWYRAVEYIERSDKISKKVFPPLLSAIRNSGMKIIHVADNSGYADDFEGAKKAVKLAQKYYGNKIVDEHTVSSSAIHTYLSNFKRDFSFPGKDNIPDIERGRRVKGFIKNAMPDKDEYIATDSRQLHSICLEHGINHLIYIGFAINWCLQYSPGNMNDMTNKGLICSTIKEAVTAVENKTSAESQNHKEYSLWVTALKNGFVYDVDDFIPAISQD